MNKAKYVSPLSELDEEWLGWIENDFTLSRRHRLKAQAIRLSAQGFKIDRIALVCEQRRATVSGWIDRWQRHKFDFFVEKPRPGRPCKLKAGQETRVLEWVEEEPRSKKRLRERVEREFRVSVSEKTIERLLKKTRIATSV